MLESIAKTASEPEFMTPSNQVPSSPHEPPTQRESIRSPEEVLDDIDSLQRLIDRETRDEFEDPTLDELPPIPEHPHVCPISARNQSSVRTTPCVACGHASARPCYLIEGIGERLVTCERCGLGSLHPMPSSQRIASFYPPEYYGTPDAKFERWVEAAVRLGAQHRVRTLLHGLPTGGRVLDIGCGRGVMLRAMLDNGFEAHGVEISAAAAAGADPRAKIRIAHSLQDANYGSHQFDAVVLWHVLEHVRQPAETLAEVARILVPGGRLIVAVPNFASWQSTWAKSDWFHLDLPRHLYHFSDRTLSRLVERAGFEVRDVRHFALLQNPFGWLQSVLNRCSNTPRNALYSLLHRYGDQHCNGTLHPVAKLALRAAYWCGLPIAGAISCLEALARRGGTITLIAQT